MLKIIIFFLCFPMHGPKISPMFTRFVCVAAGDITTIESLQFDLATIQAATNKFSDDNRLGGGGFGEVYKVLVFIICCLFLNLFSGAGDF